jgi:hypothetical protein
MAQRFLPADRIHFHVGSGKVLLQYATGKQIYTCSDTAFWKDGILGGLAHRNYGYPDSSQINPHLHANACQDCFHGF